MILKTIQMIFLILICFNFKVQGQLPASQASESPQVPIRNFQPSLAVILGIPGAMLFITVLLLIYAKFFHRRSITSTEDENRPGLAGPASRFSGIDKAVIESLPFFRFSSLRGSKEGLECPVCLSKFEDIEILRLLPQCKHAFHVNCVDQWLEKHSSCPLCRQKVSYDDPTLLTYTDSMRLLFHSNNPSELREEEQKPIPNIELYVQRDETQNGSSRFSLGRSSRKPQKGCDEVSLINKEDGKKVLHKFNHRIIVSDVVFQNRWSNRSPSDLMFLSTKMVNDSSGNRFSSLGSGSDRFLNVARTSPLQDKQVATIEEEIEMKTLFENKVENISKSSMDRVKASTSRELISGEATRRSVSEITAYSRFSNLNVMNMSNIASTSSSNHVKEERLRSLWMPIARTTLQWFANRERSQQAENIRERLHV